MIRILINETHKINYFTLLKFIMNKYFLNIISVNVILKIDVYFI